MAIIVCPNRVNEVPVSIITKPVTVTADVAVNRLCSQVIGKFVEIGNIKSSVPIKIKHIKLPARISGGAALTF